MSQTLEAIVIDPKEGKLRIQFAGDLCQGLMVPCPDALALGSAVTLRIRVRAAQGYQTFEGSARVLRLDGGALAEGPLPLRPGLMVGFDMPTFVRRRSPHDLPAEDDFFALPPDTIEERDPWSESGELDDTVKLPNSPFWTGDTSKVAAAPSRPTGGMRFTSVQRSDAIDDELSGPWKGPGSSIVP